LLTSKSGGEDMLTNMDPLAGCRYVAAMELAYEPRVRKLLRQLYRRQAVLSTRPTKKGLSIIDTFHEHYGLHLIREKPIKDHFADSELMLTQHSPHYDRRDIEDELRRKEKESCLQFLRLTKAERAGFIKMKIHLPSPHPNDDWYKEDIAEHIQVDLRPFMEVLEKVCFPPGESPNDGTSSDADRLWCEERVKVLRQALTSFILPQFETELLRDLSAAAVKFGISETADGLKALAFEGPYRPTHLLGENRFLVPTGELPIVGVCVAQDNREASYLSALSPTGELKASLAIPSGKHITDPQMRDQVLQFLVANRPAAVLVGTSGGLVSRMMSRKLQEIVSEATEKWNNRYVQGEDEDDDEYDSRTREFRQKYMVSNLDDDDEDEDEMWKCNVDLLDDNVPQLFGRSIRGTKEFADAQFFISIPLQVAFGCLSWLIWVLVFLEYRGFYSVFCTLLSVFVLAIK
jgi:transcription elongation factor SPT6